MVDLRSISILVSRRYIASTLVVLMAMSPVAWVMMSEYKQLQKEKDLFTTERMNFEKNRFDAEAALLAKESELARREFELQQLEAQNKERLAVLRQRAAEYSVAAEKLTQDAVIISQSRRQKEAEEKLQHLMSEFSNMGIDLNSAPRCDDEALIRYRTAKAKYSEAFALAEANELYERYKHFFKQNQQWLYSGCLSGKTGSATQ